MESLAVILPIIAGGSVVVVTGLSLYFKIRHRFPIRVNCWFCNKNTDVPYLNRNCWDCPNCEQYNGFLPDGNYNKTIPAHHDELLNHPVNVASSTLLGKKQSPVAKGNGLCRKCNINQELKVQQLAVFTPVNPARYDEEVDLFRSHLERAYRLCSPCEDVLKHTLHKQKSMLLGVRLKQLRIGSVHGKKLLYLMKTKCYALLSSWDYIIRYFTALLSAWLVLATSFNLNEGHFPVPPIVQNFTAWSYLYLTMEDSSCVAELLKTTLTYEVLLTTIGMAAQLAVAMTPKKCTKIDMISLCFWTIQFFQSWIKRHKKLEKYITLLDFNMAHVAVAFISLIICTCNILIPRKRHSTVRNHVSTRKVRALNSSDSSFNISNISNGSSTYSSHDEEVNDDSPVFNNHKEETNLPPPLKSAYGLYPHTTLSTSGALHHVRESPLPVPPINEDENSEDLGRGFGNLTLGSSACDKWIGRKNESIPSFETKVYGQSSCDLFEGSTNNLRNRRRPIIRPSQLNLCKNMTQSSWVAGGYWQSPFHNRTLPISRNESPPEVLLSPSTFAPLSRSSSQSSGFVSQSSQPGVYDGVATSLPNSRAGSMCGADFDRFSALSEPIYPYTTAPVYFSGGRPGSFFGAPYYGGPPLFVHPAYSLVPQPPGFLSSYVSPLPSQPQPVLNQTPCYYASQQTRPLGSIWNPSAFSPLPQKQIQNRVSTPAIDVLSQSDSQHSNESEDFVNKSVVDTAKQDVPIVRQRTIVSAVKENLFLAILFCSSLLFNALILIFVMLGNSNMLLSGIL